MKQLAAARGFPQEIQDDLAFVLQQLGVINGVRNAVVHYGAASGGKGKAIVSNALKAKGEPTEFPISPDLLDLMYWDLRKITAHLYIRHLKRRPADATVASRVMKSNWQYKHSPRPKARSRNLAS